MEKEAPENLPPFTYYINEKGFLCKQFNYYQPGMFLKIPVSPEVLEPWEAYIKDRDHMTDSIAYAFGVDPALVGVRPRPSKKKRLLQRIICWIRLKFNQLKSITLKLWKSRI